MAKFVYVDNSNVWIEGMKVSAVVRNLAFDVYDAAEHRICDQDWKYDFGKLLTIVGGTKNNIKRAVLVGSRPPQNDSLWEAARRCGFETVIKTRDRQNREKQVDIEIAVAMMEDSISLVKSTNEDEMILIAGDSDYVPMVQSIVRRGITLTVWFWEHASNELKREASGFVSLDQYIDEMRR